MTQLAPPPTSVPPVARENESRVLISIGDYIVKYDHLYFVLDYATGGYMVENCDTLLIHKVAHDFMDKHVRWIATDTHYRKSHRRKEVENRIC
jgi:hypothetical protein